jgi:beta-lactamase regulating signal transducer with metallopeptidase domain
MTSMTIDLVGWTLINSLWQGSVIALFLAAALRLMRHAGASARYAVSIAALGAMIAVPVATTITHREATSNAAIGASMAHARSARAVPGSAPTVAARTGLSMPMRMPMLSQFLETVDVRAMSRPLDGALLWIVSAWLTGVLLLLARLIGGIARTRRFAREGVELLDDSAAETARRVAARLGIRTVVRILKSTRVDVPMVVGWAAPAVLIPASLLTGLAPVQLEMLLAHELAHIRRYDTLVNLVQRIIETLLFFHPCVWWVSSRVRDERENCCDDLALAITGADRVAYSKALLFMEESRGTTLPLAMAATGGSLLRRVRRLVSGELDPIGPGSRGVATIVSIVAMLIVASTVSATTVVRRGAEQSPSGARALSAGIAFQAANNHVAMAVESAARRGRLEILAVDSAAPVLRNGLNLAPLGVRGDYYLFDSTSFVLVRPASKTFAIFAIVDAAYNFNDGREGWPDVFDIPSAMRTQPVSAAQGAMRQLERHGAFRIYWHVDVDSDVPSFGVLSRGRLGVGDAPLGESTVAGWFGPALALAQLARIDSTWFPNDRLGLAIVAPLVGDNASTTNFMSKHRLAEIRITPIDLSRLTLPSDYRAVAIAGSLTESQAKERIVAWRTSPRAR